jgi:hypothetical protein
MGQLNASEISLPTSIYRYQLRVIVTNFEISLLAGFETRKRQFKQGFLLLKSQFILQAVVIYLAECYGEGVLQCLGERHSVGPLRS